jgi:hypothetical protein
MCDNTFGAYIYYVRIGIKSRMSTRFESFTYKRILPVDRDRLYFGAPHNSATDNVGEGGGGAGGGCGCGCGSSMGTIAIGMSIFVAGLLLISLLIYGIIQYQ